MVIYDLICDSAHRFEGWFKDKAEYAQQCEAHLLGCPVCGTHRVRRIPSGSHVRTDSSGAGKDREPGSTGGDKTQHKRLLRLHEYIERNFEDVGTGFAEEARKIHFGETEVRNIRGLASREEAKTLEQEGIETVSLPPKPVGKEKLN